MRTFFALVFGLIIGAFAALVADRVSPTQEMIAKVAERVLPPETPNPPQGPDPLLSLAELPPGEAVFQPGQLLPLGIEPCFPRPTPTPVTERPWLTRDINAAPLDTTRLDPFPNLEDYPGLIKIEGIRSPLGTEREHCAAVRVAQHWFMTAAHCIIDLDITTARPTFDVIAVTPSTDVRSENTVVVPLRGAVCHAAYGMNRQQYPNDIALFYLDDVSAFETVAIAALETADLGLLPTDLGETYVAGWGRNGGTRYLQGGPVTIAEAGEAVLIADKVGARGPNVGDSGAPLYLARNGGEPPLVIGTLSQVSQDQNTDGDRSIYVRTKTIHDWAARTMATCAQDGRYLCSSAVASTEPPAP